MTTTLQAPHTIEAEFGSIEIGWDGEPLENVVAIDTETVGLGGEGRIPPLVLMSVSDGTRHVILPPVQVADFLVAHRDAMWVMFNAAFDFWALMEYLEQQAQIAAMQCMWQTLDRGNLRDGLLLSKLLVLAQTGAVPFKGQSLEKLAKDHVGIELDKAGDEIYRLHYDQLLGVDWGQVKDPGWFIYAAKDAYATLHLYAALWESANSDYRDYMGPIDHGVLTETLQVKGAVSLASITRNGMAVDRKSADALYDRLSQERDRRVGEIESLLADDAREQSLPVLTPFERDSQGRIKYTNKGEPRTSRTVLQQVLLRELDRYEKATGLKATGSWCGKGQGISIAADQWSPYRAHSKVIDLWLELKSDAKLMQLIPRGVDRVYPKYNPLLVTGRVSCSDPNIQQVPRTGGVREVFVATPGHLLIGADYSCLELRVLAHICRGRFGFSNLAEVFERNEDPHEYTARLILGLDAQTMEAMKISEPERYKIERQKAKAVNFGVPGGMGAAALCGYAKSTFGVEMSEVEANALREKLITEVYPEIGRYIEEDAMQILAHNLGCESWSLWRELDFTGERSGAIPGSIRRVVFGHTQRADGQPYNQKWLDRVWDTLSACNNNPRFHGDLHARRGRENLAQAMFDRGAWTESGRYQAHCDYTQARNTPFQGLAADGAKLALFELVRRGWRVVAFIHDEIIVEVPEDGDVKAKAQELRTIMREAMQKVVHRVPIEVGDLTIMDRWSK